MIGLMAILAGTDFCVLLEVVSEVVVSLGGALLAIAASPDDYFIGAVLLVGGVVWWIVDLTHPYSTFSVATRLVLVRLRAIVFTLKASLVFLSSNDSLKLSSSKTGILLDRSLSGGWGTRICPLSEEVC